MFCIFKIILFLYNNNVEFSYKANIIVHVDNFRRHIGLIKIGKTDLNFFIFFTFGVKLISLDYINTYTLIADKDL